MLKCVFLLILTFGGVPTDGTEYPVTGCTYSAFKLYVVWPDLHGCLHPQSVLWTIGFHFRMFSVGRGLPAARTWIVCTPPREGSCGQPTKANIVGPLPAGVTCCGAYQLPVGCYASSCGQVTKANIVTRLPAAVRSSDQLRATHIAEHSGAAISTAYRPQP